MGSHLARKRPPGHIVRFNFAASLATGDGIRQDLTRAAEAAGINCFPRSGTVCF
jgi:hypothetical protein